MKNFYHRPVDIEMHVSGNMAWAIFRYNLKADMDGGALDNVGIGTTILVRQGPSANARWIVRHTQTSSRARRVAAVGRVARTGVTHGQPSGAGKSLTALSRP